jgi:hypothetical protein
MKDLWNWFIGLPKCVKGGRCNQDREHYYIDEIKTSKNSTIVSGYRYYCTKCDKNTSEYGKI